MKHAKRVVSAALCLALFMLSTSAFAVNFDKKTVTVKSAQNLFSPFSRVVNQGDNFDVVIRLRSDLAVVDGTVEVGFDSSYLEVTSCEPGDGIDALSNITAERQQSENNVISIFTAGGGFYDFTSEKMLITYSFTATDNLDENKEITVDFKNLTANKTYVKDDETVDISVDGDVKLISKSEVVSDGFSVRAVYNPLKGDVDLNGMVNVNDATMLQLYLANRIELTDLQKSVAEVYHDEKINIRDVTMIQLFLAGLVELT